MKQWKQALVAAGTTILVTRSRPSIARGCQIALVVDDAAPLLGTISDGDIRRGVLKGMSLTDPAQRLMHPKPTVRARGRGPR